MILQPMLQVRLYSVLHALVSLTACPVTEMPHMEVAAACSFS